MSVLAVNHLQKHYREKGKTIAAVQDVSLNLNMGEVLAFLGPNGAGKTTTIKMIAGLIRPDAGQVSIVGRNPHRDSAALRQLGAVLEGNRNLYWRLTAAENLEYFGVLRGISRRLARQRGQHLLERFGLMDKRNTVVQKLSRGMQQKLAIAVSLVHDPQLLLLDEPTLGLDVEATQTVKQLIREIAAEGRAILLTTHQLDIAEELSDRVAIIQRGVLVAQESTADLIRQFAGTAYILELELPLEGDRRTKLEAMGVDLGTDLGDRTLVLHDATLLYPVLDILKPLPLLRIEKEQATLTEVFLRLVNPGKEPMKEGDRP
ncbi:MAG: ABC transporter ATP-binding protein [Kaiparowitsia implicata GSE-PSE-MK54-09C]|nr:ABC transporter ATP-binding protein [Kaiparowitsia implicata GSE-PSE-MK54-09C]